MRIVWMFNNFGLLLLWIGNFENRKIWKKGRWVKIVIIIQLLEIFKKNKVTIIFFSLMGPIIVNKKGKGIVLNVTNLISIKYKVFVSLQLHSF